MKKSTKQIVFWSTLINVLILFTIFWLITKPSQVKNNEQADDQTQYGVSTAQIINDSQNTAAEISLYFADKRDDRLCLEVRKMSKFDDPVAMAERIINALIKGPLTDTIATIPPDTNLRALYLTPDGTAYVDFNNAITMNHPGGVRTERLTIYSIVNSLVLNIDEIRQVKLLIEGNEAVTLAGHIDLHDPFTTEMSLIR